MDPAGIELVVNGSSPERDAALAELKTALYDANIEHVREIKVERPEPGTRPADIVAIAALAVSSVGTVAQIVGVVRAFLAGRKGGNVSVTIRIEDDSVELIDPATGTEEKAIDEFTRRHDEES